MKQTEISKASNNLEFRDKCMAFESVVQIYKTNKQVQYNMLLKLIRECLFLSHERRFNQSEKDCFDRLARTISQYIKKNLGEQEFGGVLDEGSNM